MTPQRNPPSAVDLCLTHLDREEVLLRQLRDALLGLHAALRGGNPENVRSAFAVTDGLERTAAVIARERANLAGRLAIELRIPRDRTNLSMLIARVPDGKAGQLRSRQAALLALADEIRDLRGRCDDLLAYCRVYLRRLLAEVLPGAAAGPRYGPAGTPLDPPRRARLLARG
jgi:hypothetical protein